LNPTLQDRLAVVVANFDEVFGFYESETVKYSRWYVSLLVITLSFTALTPVLLLVDNIKLPYNIPWKLIQALPSVIGGIAAAINGSLRLRQEWTQNYVTQSILYDEHQKFMARASPDYNRGEEIAIDNFQHRISDAGMSEVRSWRVSMTAHEASSEKASSARSPSSTPGQIEG
jgi:hypothetical protein